MARKTISPKDTLSLLSTSQGTLAQITKKSNYLSQVKDIVRQTCPDLPPQVWHIANIREQTCVIGVSSAIWSQRLQFEKVNIGQQLAEKTQGLFNQIEISVRPIMNRSDATQVKQDEEVKMKSMSQSSANHLLDVAANAPKGLQEKLKKLATHVNKK